MGKFQAGPSRAEGRGDLTFDPSLSVPHRAGPLVAWIPGHLGIRPGAVSPVSPPRRPSATPPSTRIPPHPPEPRHAPRRPAPPPRRCTGLCHRPGETGRDGGKKSDTVYHKAGRQRARWRRGVCTQTQWPPAGPSPGRARANQHRVSGHRRAQEAAGSLAPWAGTGRGRPKGRRSRPDPRVAGVEDY